uniref:Integral membrane protein n=1 Tax=Mycena chlorophos TaxID=658473 RepID=A0ABQ0LEB5_MYCCL|nr:predicted protein [Mycena chlorophos]
MRRERQSFADFAYDCMVKVVDATSGIGFVFRCICGPDDDIGLCRWASDSESESSLYVGRGRLPSIWFEVNKCHTCDIQGMAAGVSLAAFLATAIGVIVPWFYLSIHRAPGRPLTSTRSLLNILLLLHTLYVLYQIIVLPPDNIFKRLHLPLSTPVDAVRSFLRQKSDTGRLPASLDTLLRHLQSYDVKTFYVRFGHRVVATCDYCHSFNDFAMFALPDAMLSYIWAATVVGLVTINNTGHERYRTLAVGAIAGSFAVEAYYIATSPIEIPQDDEGVFWWHDSLLLLRQTMFLIVPIFVHLLPASPTAPLLNPTVNATRLAEQALLRMQLLRLTRGAIMRVPLLRTRAAEWWEGDARDGQWVREDKAVQDLARQLGSGFDDTGGNSDSEDVVVAPLRANARNAVTTLRTGFLPSEFWKVPPSP